MYGTRDAPQIWQDAVQKAMKDLAVRAEYIAFIGFLPPFAETWWWSSSTWATSCVQERLEDLQWLCRSMKEKYDLQHAVLTMDGQSEVKSLNRIVRWTS